MFAHSPYNEGDWTTAHTLKSHSEGTSRLGTEFGTAFSAGDLVGAAGLCHDTGKAYCRWQPGLVAAHQNKTRVGVPHADVGAALLPRALGPAALAILGHHRGLTKIGDLADIGTDPADAARITEATAAFLTEVPQAKALLECDSLIPRPWHTSESVLDVGLRMAFSALVDADYLDTAAHFAGQQSPPSARDLDPDAMVSRYESMRAEKFAPKARTTKTIVDMAALRAELYEHAVSLASLKPGMFTMTAPTGTGKTLTSMGFALHHAAHNRLRRIVMTVPFITITRQNAAVLQEFLGADTVLEHHSGVDTDALPPWARLGMENWDAPVVVTTTVQLLESVFARRPGRMRKLHRLARSVIILDEVQSLPAEMLIPILDVLRVLVEHMGCTVVLCTATQPTFHRLPIWQDLKVQELVAQPAHVAHRAGQRVRYRYWLDPRLTWEQVAADAATRDKALLITNTLKDTLSLYRACQRAAPNHTVVHLSRGMCDQHIVDTLKRIIPLLDGPHNLLVVSTQLIEAGVDIDFPFVYRMWATGEAHAQAAGRCNRHGLLDEGLVTIVDAEGASSPPGYYKAASDMARRYFGPDGLALPDDLDAMNRYFHGIYTALGLTNTRKPRDKSKYPDWLRIQENRFAGNFTDVTEGPHRFRMIEDDTVPVAITSYKSTTVTAADVPALLDELRQHAERPGRADRVTQILRQLQPFVVPMRRSVASRPAVRALLAPVVSDGLYEWRGSYSLETGLETDTPSESFIV
ncbi:CRISPR-associated helicase Cas3' [Solihabitans fulvus]|uniref:CRISPR-associated helicase Cas3 n=1 Tax=Solihabitans fulvus TaxID=1892852 RepID=A0A5B2WFW8_9PSEU|nr:CRISPR-associated helicase Cas3' [Solihabitans fulvus]KAA2249552.1 CRISPR-associated helicase Cas3' [Solihabitans fulvus]